MILFLSYVAVVGLMTTADYLRYQGKVGITRCFLLSLLSPLYLLNLILGILLSFFGILYVTKVAYIDFDSLKKQGDGTNSESEE